MINLMKKAFLMGITATLSPVFLYAQENKPKNIVLIAVDDLNDWVGFMNGHPDTRTPNMDRLAAMGMYFEHAYCAAPVSNASRAALLTGYRSSTTGVYSNAEFMRDSPILEKAVTLPKYFSNHGYYSMSRGKIFHQPSGPRSDPQSWDIQGQSGGVPMKPEIHEGKQANGLDKQTTGGSVMLDWAGVDVDETKTNDYLNCKWAAEELLKEHEKPFFMACGIFRPHLPWYVPQKYFDRFDLDDIDLPPHDPLQNMERLSERALTMTGYDRPEHEYNVLKEKGMEKEAVRAYLASISYADDCIGQIVDALEKSPERENTIVVLWGDHGWHLGEKMRYRKFSLWERSCRVPLIIIAPGVTTPGTVCDSPVNLLDLYPTLVSLAGLPENSANEGNDITPLLIDPEKEWTDKPSITTLSQNEHSVCDGRYRYIIYKDGTEELYDHLSDALEWNNLAEDPDYSGVKERLRSFIPEVNVPSIKVKEIEKSDKKPIVWIYTDMSDKTIPGPNKEGTLNDPDDISAMAGYLLLADRFDTRGIVVASTHRSAHRNSADQADWAQKYFGEAYKEDLINLRQKYPDFPSSVTFTESSIKDSAEKYDTQRDYSKVIHRYASVTALLDLIEKEEEIINVLCWGSLTEPAILVNMCINSGREALLKKVRFIGHWTDSSLHQGSHEHPEDVANCREDAAACSFMKTVARQGMITYFECGAIGQHGIVSGSPKGLDYFNQFKHSRLGEIFATGKYAHETVDDSDCATYYVLLGEYGVSLSDIPHDGTNSPEIEKNNEMIFRSNAAAIREELLRRSNIAAGIN